MLVLVLVPGAGAGAGRRKLQDFLVALLRAVWSELIIKEEAQWDALRLFLQLPPVLLRRRLPHSATSPELTASVSAMPASLACQ